LPKLWRYNLHYHDYIWDLRFEDAKRLALAWIQRHGLERGADGWEPYPTSLRIGNWLKYFLGTQRDQTIRHHAFLEMLVSSLAQQAKWLLNKLEFHLLANHLMENAVALCTVGSLFDGPLGQACRRRGWSVLREQLPEQILADGGHFERSPMYHSRMLYCLADLYNLADGERAGMLEPYLRAMTSWLAHLCHPDGQIALLNDAATNIYLSPCDLLKYVEGLLPAAEPALSQEVPSDQAFACAEAGYYGWRGSDGTYLVCDAAPIGPDYQPGHGHADIFGFEMSIRGQRVIVDSGTFDYEQGPSRDFARSTAAHNTIELDGQDQCEFWGAFRVARRGRPHDVRFTGSEEGFTLSGWHDGYQRLPGAPRHHRRFHWDRKGLLRIQDNVASRKRHRVVSRLHFHPDCVVTCSNPGATKVTWPGGCARLRAVGYEEMRVQSYDYSAEFGQKRSASCLSCITHGSDEPLTLELALPAPVNRVAGSRKP